MEGASPGGDWQDLQLFLAVLRAGTQTDAAAALGVDQSTISRRVEAFARRLGTALLERRGGRWVATAAGTAALRRAERAEREVQGFFREAAGLDQRAEGSVRLTAPEGLGIAVLAPRLEAFRERHPRIALLLSADAAVVNLARREADVALRLARPQQSELVVRRVARVPFSLWASAAYLRAHPRRGRVLLADDALVALEQELDDLPESAWARRRSQQVRLRVRSPLALAAAVASGAGVGLVAGYLGDHFGLQRIEGGPRRVRDLFLVFHRSLRRSARVRAVAEFAVGCLEAAGMRGGGEATP